VFGKSNAEALFAVRGWKGGGKMLKKNVNFFIWGLTKVFRGVDKIFKMRYLVVRMIGN